MLSIRCRHDSLHNVFSSISIYGENISYRLFTYAQYNIIIFIHSFIHCALDSCMLSLAIQREHIPSIGRCFVCGFSDSILHFVCCCYIAFSLSSVHDPSLDVICTVHSTHISRNVYIYTHTYVYAFHTVLSSTTLVRLLYGFSRNVRGFFFAFFLFFNLLSKRQKKIK